MFCNKKADEAMLKSFWAWFEQNEEWIIATSKTDGMAVVNAVDEKYKSCICLLSCRN